MWWSQITLPHYDPRSRVPYYNMSIPSYRRYHLYAVLGCDGTVLLDEYPVHVVDIVLIVHCIFYLHLLVKMKSSNSNFYGRYHDLIDRYGLSVSQMTTDIFRMWLAIPFHLLMHDLSLGFFFFFFFFLQNTNIYNIFSYN